MIIEYQKDWNCWTVSYQNKKLYCNSRSEAIYWGLLEFTNYR